MFDLEQAIVNWRRELFLAGVKAPETLDELEEHLRERIASLERGLDGADAFQTAVAQLGEGGALRREFGKVNQFRFLNLRKNPAALNFLALCFVLLTVNNLAPVALLFLSLQLFAGLGLLRRRSVWWKFAFAALALSVFSELYTLALDIPVLHKESAGTHFLWMGISVSRTLHWLINFCALGVRIWGVWYLRSPEVRNIFDNNSKAKPV